jgi:hypothetical protein
VAVAIFLIICVAVFVLIGMLLPDHGADRKPGIEEDSAGTDSGG